MARKTGKGDVESKCARIKKHASNKVAKAEVNLNHSRQKNHVFFTHYVRIDWWTIDYELFWLDIYIQEWLNLFGTNALTYSKGK